MKKSSIKFLATLVISALTATGMSTAANAESTPHEYTVDCAFTASRETRYINVPETATEFKLSFAENCVGWIVQGGNANGLHWNQTSHGAGFTMTSPFALNWFGTVTAGGETGWVIGTIMPTANSDTLTYGVGSNFSVLSYAGNLIFITLGSEDPVDPEDPEDPVDPLEGTISTVYFKGNSKWLKKNSRNKLKALVAAVIEAEVTTLNLDGFTPITRKSPKAPDFAALALNRAEMVKKVLLRKFARAEYEITLNTTGTAAPRLIRDKTYKLKSDNRRVVISVPAPVEG
jgi:outer membrane protein OmpA-like peptidoglycan-associated protein